MSWRGKVQVTDLQRALSTVSGCVGIKASKGKKGVYIIKGKKETGNLLGCWLLGGSLLLVHSKSLFFTSLLILGCLMMSLFQFCTFLLLETPYLWRPLLNPSLDRLLYNPFTILCRNRHWSRNLLEMEVPSTLWFNTRYPLTFLIHPIPAYGTSQALLKTYHWRRMGHWCFLGGRRQPPVLSQIVWNDQHPQSILTVIFSYSHIAEI